MNTATHARLAAGGAFLVAVVWFDLMFDVQVFGYAWGTPLPVPVLDSIANYYRRVTIDAWFMSPAVGLTMLLVVVGGARSLGAGADSTLRRLAFAASVAPIALAAARVFPNAQRLGLRTDDVVAQSDLARAIAVDHVACCLSIAAFTALQLRLASRAASGQGHLGR